MSRSAFARRTLGATLLAAAVLAVAASTLAARPAHARPSARASTYAPSVQIMIVGIGGQVLAPARSVTASATSMGVRGRSCAVAAGTPLAVLAADRRFGGPGFALRDYGRCGSAAVNSGELFVYALGGESNSGQSGWEYKVDGVSGSTGAADTSGALGDGRRLRSGDQLLWFWCEARAGGCQRTLALSYPSAPVARNGSLTVTVYGADNEGRLAFEPGAVVAFGGRHATAGRYGHAILSAPAAAGRYGVSATRSGMVPSFPGTIVVR